MKPAHDTDADAPIHSPDQWIFKEEGEPAPFYFYISPDLSSDVFCICAIR
jgi:hypothetical protein